jgi:hypothetical protein
LQEKKTHFCHQLFGLGMKAICYAATEKRKLSTYITLFRSLKEAAATIGINLAPSSHMMDFETAAATASKTIFDGIKISFCHFHLAQSIWRKLQKESKFHYFPSLNFNTSYIPSIFFFKIYCHKYVKNIFVNTLQI